MHDPSTQAFKIKYPWFRRSKWFPEGYHDPFITIWHEDPETDGTDDSCGWFMRTRHGDKAMLEKIRKNFESEWDSEYGGWFNKDGTPRLSVSAIAINMFSTAIHAMTKYDWDARKKFMRNHLYDILIFAENNVDSMHDGIVQKYGPEKRDERISQHAGMIYSWILRAQRPWYRHPRWHIWHWKLQVHPLQSFKRWAFTRCSKCHKGFKWGESCVGNEWNGHGPSWFKSENVHHCDCSNIGASRISQAGQAQ